MPEGFTAETVETAPSLEWNCDEALQEMLVRKVFRGLVARPVHYVPQCWKLDSPIVGRITDAVQSAAVDLRPDKSLVHRQQ
jgi:LysR family transcriptional regulator (chromosome initiation inhibitor)